jgi:hypothetical protein
MRQHCELLLLFFWHRLFGGEFTEALQYRSFYREATMAGTELDVHSIARANADSGRNQPFQLVENHHSLVAGAQTIK